jgi:anion-transporting  ArsA/GET3 family ATPase
MNSEIKHKPIEIFCGTGGVGKTTLATSRALFLASKNLKVLLITIDPAKRLKQILSLNDDDSGRISTINSSIFKNFQDKNLSFDALLMSPHATLQRMAKDNNQVEDFTNPILKILARPNSGMNEIMAIVEVQHHLQMNNYDTVILDTPPGKHFIDFLESTHKIQSFFDKSFVEIFKFIGKQVDKKTSFMPKKIINNIVSTGIKKLLSYLEKVTGKDFVNTFIEAIAVLYTNKDSFLEALTFQENLKSQDFSNWFLVASVEQQKITEASTLHSDAKDFMHSDNYLAINKCLQKDLLAWETEKDTKFDKLRSTMLEREQNLCKYAKENFSKVVEFPEVFDAFPENHVDILATYWS